MPVLVLDLDETFIVDTYREELIDQREHSIHCRISAQLGNTTTEIGILNIEEIFEVIMAADEVIILTAGSWSYDLIESIIDSFVDEFNLDVDTETSLRKKFSKDRFFSPDTESPLRNINRDNVEQDIEKTRHLPKADRLRFIINYLGLEEKKFVVLDDNIAHIDSFYNMENVTAILATTLLLSQSEPASKSFYQQAINELSISLEKNMVFPVKRSFFYYPESEPIRKIGGEARFRSILDYI